MEINIGDVFVKEGPQPMGGYLTLQYTITDIGKTYVFRNNRGVLVDVVQYINNENESFTMETERFEEIIKRYNARKVSGDEMNLRLKTYIKKHRFNY